MVANPMPANKSGAQDFIAPAFLRSNHGLEAAPTDHRSFANSKLMIPVPCRFHNAFVIA